MKIAVWSDIACPFCWIGKKHIEEALSVLGLKDATLEWKSFELDPYAKQEYEDDLYMLLANKYGQTREWAIHSAEQMEQKGKEVGIEFRFDITQSTNTFNAHRLVHLAKSAGLQPEAKEALFQAYFQKGMQLGHDESLLKVGAELGLDKDQIQSMLKTDQFSNDVRADQEEAHRLGIRAVPFFVINDRFGISGAQPVSFMVNILKQALELEEEVELEKSEVGNTCSEDSC